MTVTFTGDVAFKTRLFNVLVANELGGATPYAISFAGGASGWSFGWIQFDVRKNPTAHTLLEDILVKAVDASGNRIIDDSDPVTQGAADKIVRRLVSAARQNNGAALNAQDRALINAALGSSYGQNAIDNAVDPALNDLIATATRVHGIASPANQPFLASDIGRIFVIDYANQYGIDSPGAFEDFVSGQVVTVNHQTVQVEGALGVDDILNFYFHLEYPWKNPVDPIRRFGNIAAATGYVPADDNEAKNVFRAVTHLLHEPGHFNQIVDSNPAALNTFRTHVLEPARARIVAALQSQLPELAAQLGAIDALSIHVDPVFAGQNANNDARLDSRRFDAQGGEVANNDLLIGDGGNDTLVAGIGDDILIGGTGEDELRGGAGDDVYVHQAGDGADSIRDSGRDGRIHCGGIDLSTVNAFSWVDPNVRAPAWRAEVNGRVLQFHLYNARLDASGVLTGNLWIQEQGAAATDRIVVDDFHLELVNGQPVGDLGLNLPVSPLLAWYLQGEPNPFSQPTLPPPPDFQVGENFAEPMLVALNMPAAEAQVLRISSTDPNRSLLGICTGAETRSLASGSVDIVLAAGQTEVVISLLLQGDLEATANVTLSAQLMPVGGGAGGPVSNVNVQLIATDELPTTATVAGTSDNDKLYGLTAESNTIIGGAAGDILLGHDNRDVLYANEAIDTATAIASGATGNSGSATISIDGAAGGNFLGAGGGDDTLIGSVDRDALYGGAGRDVLVGRQGDDYLDGDGDIYILSTDPTSGFEVSLIESGDVTLTLDGEGLSRLYPAGDADAIHAGGGSDLVYAGRGDDLVHGDEGNDRIYGGGGGDTLLGGAGDDEIAGDTELIGVDSGPAGADFIDGGDGNDVLGGQSGADIVYGGAGNDSLFGDLLTGTAAGNDYLNGEDGDDALYGYAGDDQLIGGIGNDQLHGDRVDAPLADHGNDNLSGDAGNDLLYGDGGDDTLTGGAGVDTLYGDYTSLPDEAYGDDYLDGGTEDDTLVGGGGADRLYGGEGNDDLFGEGTPLADALHGADYLDGGAGNDEMFGGGGDDVLLGGIGNDSLIGDNSDGPQGKDLLRGGEGNDTLLGLGGADTMLGEEGVDVLSGGDGDDLLDGGDGDEYSETDSSIGLFGGAGNDTLRGGAGQDRLQGADGDDLLEGGSEDDFLFGGTGNDVLDGGAGADELQGGDGDDTLIGGQGDFLVGQAGNDTYVLGSGAAFVDNEGANVVIADLSDSADTWMTATTGGDVLILNTSGEAIVFSQDSLRNLEGLDLGSAGSFASGDEAVARLYRPTMLDDPSVDPLYNVVRLGATVHAGDVGLYSSEQDLVLTYSGSVSDWIDVDDLRARGALVSVRDGSEYGLASGTQAVVLHNWYESQRYDFLGIFMDDEGTFTNFAADAVDLTRHYRGSDQGDAIFGGESSDDIRGGDGDDLITGEAGADVLVGEHGDDLLFGGSGNDLYTYAAGDGADYMSDEAGADVLRFAAGIETDDVMVAEDGQDLILTIGDPANGDSIRVAGWSASMANVIERVEFSDGSFWSPFEIDSQLPGNRRPHVTDEISEQLAAPGVPFAFVVPGTTFADPNVSDVLTYTATSADGSPLPSWLTFDALTRTFSGTPTVGDAGIRSIPVRVTDPFGLTAETVFDLRVPAPVVLTGTSGSDTLVAQTPDDHQIFGLAGTDTLTGNTGDDELVGGADNDTLTGGAGSDRYVIGLADGFDVITNQRDADPSSRDVIRFGAGIRPEDVIVSRSTGSTSEGILLYLREVTMDLHELAFVDDGFNATYGHEILDAIEFDDGTVWDRSEIHERYFTGGNRDDGIVGFGGNDTIRGGSGNDNLAGRAGNDDIRGDSGFDELRGDQGDDVFRFGAGDGYDQISDTAGANRVVLDPGVSPADVTLYRSSGVSFDDEGRLFTATGDALTLVLSGQDQIRIDNFFSDPNYRPIAQIEFGDGTVWDAAEITSRIIDASGAADTFTGTVGDDTYAVDHRSDAVNESSGAGIDTVLSSVSYQLSANVENLTLTGVLAAAAFGNALQNTITGNAATNLLYGGGSGATDGVDTLVGGAGDDIYEVDGAESSAGVIDVIVEAPNEGYDRMVATAYSATLPANVEMLVVFGMRFPFFVPTTSQFYHGNDLDNVIDATSCRAYGNGFTIDGGVGADLMIGPLQPTFNGSVPDRNIRYIVDNVGDVVIGGTTGLDVIVSSVTYTLPNAVEEIQLTGSAPINATGNVLNNRLNGATNSAANILAGGLGNDQYTLGAGDVAVENADEGIDTIVLTANAPDGTTFGIASFTNFENLSVANSVGVVNLQGDAGNNALTGNGNANELRGDLGNDTLTGGTGNDIYSGFGVASGNDVILNSSGNDSICFSATENIRIDQLQFSRAGNDLVISISAQSSITVQSWFVSSGLNVVENFVLYDEGLQYTYTAEELTARANGAGSAPRANSAIPPQTAEVNQAFSFVVPANTFVDADGQSSLTLSATLEDGSPLPAWLTFDASTSAFTGTPVTTAGGPLSVKLTASDGSMSATTTISITLSPPIVRGTSGADHLVGDANENALHGLDGDDTLESLGNNDILLGGDGADTLLGGDGADVLEGNDGNDSLDGGTGVDDMRGHQGDDTYFVDAVDDIVLEVADVGTDEVRSSIAYTLGSHVENLTLTGGGTINGTGNELDNVLVGNSAANTLSGADGDDTVDGGAGNDTLIGGEGDDTYVVDGSDTVTETFGQGTDTVRSTAATFTLSSQVERLVLLGTGNIAGTGNTMANQITGNSGDNSLNGGFNADTLIGGLGNDTYVVDNANDQVTELAGEGTDLVRSSVSYTLSAEVENLTLTGSAATGTGNALANTLTGNSSANTLTGNDGNDTLTGAGGADTLIGGNGADIYTYSTGHGADTINNSSIDSAQDRLNFTNLSNTAVTFSRSGNDLVMTRNSTPTDNVRVTDWFTVTSNQLDFVQFSNGVVLTAADINGMFGGSLLSNEELVSQQPVSLTQWDRSLARFVDAMNHFGAHRDPFVVDTRGSDPEPDSSWFAVDSSSRRDAALRWERRAVP